MQTSLSHPCREIVSQGVIARSRDDSNPISIWTITLPSGLAVHLFQFDGRGESFSLMQRARPLYSGHWALAGDWRTRAISAGSCCSGLNVPTPLMLAHEPSILCSPDGLPEHERALVLLQVCWCGFFFSFFSFWVCFVAATFILGTGLSLIKSLGCSLVRPLICHHSNNPVICLLPAGLLSRKIRLDDRRATSTQHIYMFLCADKLFYRTVSATDLGLV